MYVPRQFAETRPQVLHEAIRAIKLATVVTFDIDGDCYHTTAMPMVLRFDGEKPVLDGHVARGNPHWRALEKPKRSMAIFQGPQAYISPSWYPSKAEHGKVVPT